ncbi:ABC transporter permease [Marinicrinis sediminis]|uniref:ABC transporter permease n=1 Tax=Marinicrinis sediminis TaxID=1652465 RepID=A0ABW5R8U5_9BACL
MLNLVLNENMKIYRRLRTWIMVGIMVVVAVIASFAYHNLTLADGSAEFWGAMVNLSMISFFIFIFTIIIAADIVAGEFTWGTIKLLLIRPSSRSKVLLSKYISMLIFAVFLCIVLFVVLFLLNAILTGFDFSQESFAIPDSEHPFVYLLKYYGLTMLSLLMVATFAFMISSAFRSSSLAIGLAMFIYFTGSIITAIFMRYSWSDYLIFKHLDLTMYLMDDTGGFADHMSLGFSLGVLAVYFVVFNIVSWVVFSKRDVAA